MTQGHEDPRLLLFHYLEKTGGFRRPAPALLCSPQAAPPCPTAPFLRCVFGQMLPVGAASLQLGPPRGLPCPWKGAAGGWLQRTSSCLSVNAADTGLQGPGCGPGAGLNAFHAPVFPPSQQPREDRAAVPLCRWQSQAYRGPAASGKGGSGAASTGPNPECLHFPQRLTEPLRGESAGSPPGPHWPAPDTCLSLSSQEQFPGGQQLLWML